MGEMQDGNRIMKSIWEFILDSLGMDGELLVHIYSRYETISLCFALTLMGVGVFAQRPIWKQVEEVRIIPLPTHSEKYIEPYRLSRKSAQALVKRVVESLAQYSGKDIWEPAPKEPYRPGVFIRVEIEYRDDRPESVFYFTRTSPMCFLALEPKQGAWQVLKKEYSHEIAYLMMQIEGNTPPYDSYVPYDSLREALLVNEFLEVFSEPLVPLAAFDQDFLTQRKILILALKQFVQFYREHRAYPRIRSLILAEVSLMGEGFGRHGIPFTLQSTESPTLHTSLTIRYSLGLTPQWTLSLCVWEPEPDLSLHPDIAEAFKKGVEKGKQDR